MTDRTFNAAAPLEAGDKRYTVHRLAALTEAGVGHVERLPFSMRVLLENLLRHEGRGTTRAAIEAVASWDPTAHPSLEISFHVARVLLQDFTGVPAIVDLAAMRDAMTALGGDPDRIHPRQPVDLVVDHSVQIDHWGSAAAFGLNAGLEHARNRERYELLRWGQRAFSNLSVVPPDTGIVHQVNLEHLARVVVEDGQGAAFADTLVGTDSHTPMVNALGVLGWGVGGIEAEAAMLGQPVVMLLPEVVGFKLTGELAAGATATDLVLTVVEMLRAHGVVGKFVEFYGAGLSGLSLPDRATLSNMAPEYGATVGFFPIDDETLRYLRLSGRSEGHVALVEAWSKAQGLFRTDQMPDPLFSETLELDMGEVVPSIAGPRRPQDRIALTGARAAWREALPGLMREPGPLDLRWRGERDGEAFEVGHGFVSIASITSCTNTSNPRVMVAAGLLAKKAAALGLRVPPWVKTSLAPGSQVVRRYLGETGLLAELEKLGFHIVGFGCTTCIGNSGPLPPHVLPAVTEAGLVATAVLSGNRNFEGRIHPHVRGNYLASPPLVVAYAIAGTMDVDLLRDPIGRGADGRDRFLRDIWPDGREIDDALRAAVRPEMFTSTYASVFEGDTAWRALEVPEGATYAWDEASTYIRRPPFFEGMTPHPEPPRDILGARVLALLGDSVTTDHISPAGAIAPDGPAGLYLRSLGVAPRDFNSFGSRRGNHEVMVRGTFANVRLRNRLAPGTEGGWTTHLPSGERTSIYEAAMRYRDEGTPLVILAGAQYGTGSSRDWAAKGTRLLGVRAVIAAGYERIHRSNLAGMGVLPLEFFPGEDAATLGLTGHEVFDITGISADMPPHATLQVRGTPPGGAPPKVFAVLARLDTPVEVQYLRHGGILPYVLRGLLAG